MELLLRPARWLTRRLELPPRALFKMLHKIHVLYFTMIGYPYYPPTFIRDKIEKQRQGAALEDVPEEELVVYRSFSQRSLWFMALIGVSHWIFVVKNIMFIFYTSSLVDLGHPASNLEQVATSPTWPTSNAGYQGNDHPSANSLTKFACLVTNCTQLSSPNGRARFASDLVRLPVFAICMSHMRAYLNPLIYTHLFGLILTCSMAFSIFVLSSLVPVWCYCRPIPASFILEALCPRSARKRAHESILTQLEALLNSQVNFCSNQAPVALFARGRHHGRLAQASDSNLLITTATRDTDHTPCKIHLRQDSEKRRACQRLRWFRANVAVKAIESTQANDFDSFLEDCLPVTVSAWFRINWTHAFMITVAVAHGSVSLAFGSMTLYLLLDYSYEQTYAQFAHQTRLDGCQFWRLGQADRKLKPEVLVTASTSAMQPIELDHLVKRWSVGELAEQLCFILGVPTFVLVMSSVHFYHAMNLLKLMIVDLKLQLMTLIELTELLKCSNLLHHSAREDEADELTVGIWDLLPSDGVASVNVSPMCRIRARLHEQIERVVIFWLKRPLKRANGQLAGTKLEERIAQQEFARQLVLDELRHADKSRRRGSEVSRELLLDLLERFHISYRLFMGTFQEYHEPVTTCLLFGFLINYGFAFIGLYWSKTLEDFVVLPIVLACVSLIVANGLVALCSCVHAAGRKLEVQLWSLVGLLTNVEDLRAKHLRHLWVRQLWLIDSGGGLALRMFNKVNVTYVVIIQSVLYTSSLLLFTYTRTSLH